MTDYREILEEIYSEIEPILNEGHVADYIPELARTFRLFSQGGKNPWNGKQILSPAGIKALELFTTKTGLSAF